MQAPNYPAAAQHEWQGRFLDMMPTIEAYAQRAFRKCRRELGDELVAAVVADSFVAFARLVELGREHDAHPTILAGFSIRRVGSGINVGTARN